MGYITKKEIDIIDIVKFVIVIIGAIIVFFVIDTKKEAREEAEFALNFPVFLNNLFPNLDIHYTNELDGNDTNELDIKCNPNTFTELNVKVYLKVNTVMPLNIQAPTLEILEYVDSKYYVLGEINPNSETDVQSNFIINGKKELTKYFGIFPPNTDLYITYNFLLTDHFINILSTQCQNDKNIYIRLVYKTEFPELISKYYKIYLTNIDYLNNIFNNDEEQMKELIFFLFSKDYIYQEKIYFKNENEIWNDFFDNPR